jgi:hypothetical protein
MDLMLILGVVLFIVVAIASGWYFAAKRRKELLAWATARGLTFSPSKDPSMESQFPAFDCLKSGDGRYAFNVSHGKWSNHDIVAFDYHYETHTHSSKGGRQTHHHYFSAVILSSPVLLKPLSIRPEGFFDKIGEFFGADDIDFESAEFSRKFYVKSPDKKWAYDVIHQRTMEFMLASPQFSLQFSGSAVIAWRGTTFKIPDFEQAAKLIEGILDRLPEYVLKQQPPSIV